MSQAFDIMSRAVESGCSSSCKALLTPQVRKGAPRASGGGPRSRSVSGSSSSCSPRERGWSGRGRHRRRRLAVLPARAGVVRQRKSTSRSTPSAPRASGGGPPTRLHSAREYTCSPRERGWSGPEPVAAPSGPVLPARAGVVRRWGGSRCTSGCAPRASGGGPYRWTLTCTPSSCSPRERGWSGHHAHGRRGHHVLPARAGVVRGWCSGRLPGRSAPRASGGGPPAHSPPGVDYACSPRERGWSAHRADRVLLELVLPARAGVVPHRAFRSSAPLRAPRASGGGPPGQSVTGAIILCSPRERGWSDRRSRNPRYREVLPARAGVVRRWSPGGPTTGRAPRASGGGPQCADRSRTAPACSPRERGWSVPDSDVAGCRAVLPARAGVVRGGRGRGCSYERAPRASGGGPRRGWPPGATPTCSPRERGWTGVSAVLGPLLLVLPARAGVDRVRAAHRGRRRRAPRASGGGPAVRGAAGSSGRCSPRERGWTADPGTEPGTGQVLPARAGVDRFRRDNLLALVGAPRASGGGPRSTGESRSLPACSPRERGWVVAN